MDMSPSVCLQEDDINGEHIVAFAEEDDPGYLFYSLFIIIALILSTQHPPPIHIPDL